MEKIPIGREFDFKIVQGHRAVRLQDGDVVEINGMLLKYEDGNLYEVEKELFGEGRFKIVQYTYTGRAFTPQEINELIKR